MDESLNAILAMNGDYYGNGGDGVVIRNGEVFRTSTSSSDVCVLYYDGTMKTFSAEEFDVDQAIKDGAWQAWCFGPELLNASGNSMTKFTAKGHISGINPRSAIGYYEPGHYCMIVVDGRQSGYSEGMTLTQLSELFEDLGCAAAYNMDGGKSSVMTFADAVVNQPSDGGREVSDSILIKEVE
jgi:exopolysaccharide biosynthesis protein